MNERLVTIYTFNGGMQVHDSVEDAERHINNGWYDEDEEFFIQIVDLDDIHPSYAIRRRD